MNHLTSDELIDAMDGLLDASPRQHLNRCDECKRELAELCSVLREAREVSVPEPSPLFWQHFSERVRAAVDAEVLPAGEWARWLRWPVLVPIGALALLLLALLVPVPKEAEWAASPAVNDTANDRVTGDVALADDRWVLVADLVGELDWDTASAAGLVVGPGAAEQAVLELSPDEQQELTRLLRAELQRAKS